MYASRKRHQSEVATLAYINGLVIADGQGKLQYKHIFGTTAAKDGLNCNLTSVLRLSDHQAVTLVQWSQPQI